MVMLTCVLAAFGLLGGTLRAHVATRVQRPKMSLDPTDWKLLSRRDQADGSLTLAAAEAGTEAQVVTVTIPRSEDAPSLGLLLDEIASNGDAGIVAVEGLIKGGNGEKATAPLLVGDALVAAAEVGRPATGVSLEGLPFDSVVERLSSLDSAIGVVVSVKRLVRKPRATVTIRFPQVEERADEVLTLYEGANLRRAMLSSGMVLNDPLARRFDAGVGTGDCGGEGTCCTCAVEVAKGLDALSKPSSQEIQMVTSRFPRWRLACKTTLGPIEQDEEIVLRVQPRNWDGFYSEDEVDVDGKPLARDRKR